MKVELLPSAEPDIVRQFRHYLLEQDAPLIAGRFREAVIASINQLKPSPRIGSLFRGSIPGLRSWPVKGFDMIRIYYVDDPNKLRVVRVLHGKRSVRQVLSQEKLPY